MYNSFELLGPPDDPAGVRGLEAPEALQRVAAGRFRFVSRGDESGTHQREQKLWVQGGGQPAWDEYVETGQGMGATLVVANQMLGYVLADRGTFLSFRSKIDLVPLAVQSPAMRNPYGVIVVSRQAPPSATALMAQQFADYLVSPRCQAAIEGFQVEGEPLFFPIQPTSQP